jgi:hypothetical protein
MRAAVLAFIALMTPSTLALAAQAAIETPAALAAKASPDLVGALSKEMGASQEQAAGAAGALFGMAKSRLTASEFSQVANAVPGMDLLLKAIPTGGGTSNDPIIGALTGSVSNVGGSAANLSVVSNAFSKLGLSPTLVVKAIPVLTSFVTKSGGANVGSLLAGVLK